jgi:hypothetical protein
MSSIKRPSRATLSWTVFLLSAVLSFVPSTGSTQSETSRARYSNPSEAPSAALRFTPLKLEGGSKLTLISPSQWSDLADALVDTLTSTHGEYTKLFGTIPAFATSIRLMDDQAFYELTGAPSWTNAMYFRGQIIIPLAANQPIDMENLHRSVRHEYTHAIISALSGGRAPGWIDEGIAQWAEGTENPALKPALENWLKTNEPVPLRFLQGGFTKLNPAMVPAAYAQSLFAARAVIKTYGFEHIGAFLTALRNGSDKDQAFITGFGVGSGEFESALGSALKQWAAEQLG